MGEYENTIAVWVGFVSSVNEKLRTHNYNREDDPAEITQRTDTGIVIRGRVLHAPEDLSCIRTVSIAIELLAGEVKITCQITSWSQVPKGQQPTIEFELPIEFKIVGDRLQYNKLQMTIPTAVDYVWDQAFST